VKILLAPSGAMAELSYAPVAQNGSCFIKE